VLIGNGGDKERRQKKPYERQMELERGNEK
jgi:hypothetical protein